VPFNLSSLQVGTPVPVLNGVQGLGAVGLFGLSESGTLAYVAGDPPLRLFCRSYFGGLAGHYGPNRCPGG
jgi:hypothetical protein